MAPRRHPASSVTFAAPRPVNPVRALQAVFRKPLSDGLTLSDHLVAGGSASAVAVSVMHPLDTLKTVLQKAPSPTPTAAAAATAGGSAQGVRAASAGGANALSALVATIRAGGPTALYRGLAPSLLSQVPAGAIKFAAYEGLTQCAQTLVRRARAARPSSSSSASAAAGGAPPGVDAAVDYVCAALAFVACSVVLVPGELLKQRLQAGVYSGVVGGAARMLRADGLRGMYVGYGATLARDVPYTMLEFGLYAQFKRALRAVARKQTLTSREELLMGGLAGGCTGFLTTPLDLAKTRLMTQTAATAPGAVRYKGIVDVLVNVARTEGVSGLFKGSSARIVWLVPFTAIYFGVHEASKRVLMKNQKRTAAATAPSAKVE